MEKKVIISDLTLSAAEGVAETKAKRFWENRMKPYEKVRFLAGHFDRFIKYNPEYVQEGPIQIVVSATKDVGAYQIGPDEYMEDVLVSRTPLRGAKYFVALLGEARNCASSHRRFQRCLYANTFYLHIDGKGVIHLDRLLDNNDWLFADRVDRALEIAVKRLGGKMSEEEKPQWCDFSYGEIKDFGRVGYYAAKDGRKRLIICMLNSGTILPELDANDVKLSVLSRKGEYSDMVNPLLRFRMLSNNIVARVSADNVNAFMR